MTLAVLDKNNCYIAYLRKFLILAFTLPAAALAGVDLVVNNTDTPDPVVAGGVVTYTVRVTNDSVTATQATGVTTSHAVSANATYEGNAGAGVACSGMTVGQAGPGTVTCTLPNLAPSGGEVIFTIQLGSTVSGNISLGATAASTEPDDAAGNNTLNQSTTVSAGADVVMQVTPAAGTAASGSAYSFALAVSNSGPDAASSLVVTMPVPTGFNVTSVPGGCSNSAGVITCTVAGPIASGATFPIGNVTGQIIAAGGSTITSSTTVAVSGGAPPGTAQDPDASDNTALASITVTPGSDLAITKTRSLPGNLTVGQTFNFVLTPTYSGGSPSSLTITDTIPANYTVGAVVASQNGWTCGAAGQTITCTKPAGGAAGLNQALGAITIPVTVATAGPNVINTANITSATPDPNAANNTATDGGVNLLDPTVNLGVSKSGPSPALVVVGVPFNYNVTANNTGTSVYVGTMTVTDTLPAGLTVNGYTLNGWSCTPAAPVVGPASIACSRTYTAGSPLGIGATTPAAVLNTTATAPGTLNNSVNVIADSCNLGAGNCGDGDVANYAVTATIGVDSADIRLIKTVGGPDPVAAGEVLTYALEVVNAGPSTSADIVLTDTFNTLISNGVGPTGAGYVGHSIAAGLSTGASCASAASGGTGRALTCTFTTLPVCVAGSGNCPVVTVQVRPGGNGGSRSNTANVISNGTADPDHSNEISTVSSAVTPRADVTVSKSANPDPVSAGQNLTYVVTATNVANNLSAADNVTITDTLPLNVTFISASPSAGTCGTTPGANTVTTVGSRTVTCNLGTINNGAQRTVTIVVRPNTGTRGTTLTNSVSVTTSTVETDGSNNAATALATVNNPSLDLILNKVDTVDPVAVGDLMSYTITVNNAGASAAENVIVNDPLPAAGLSFQSVTPSAGSCPTQPAVDSLGGTVTCNLGYMPANTTRTVTVNMKGVLKGIYANTATVTSDEVAAGFDTNAPNNTASENTTVRTKADLEVVSKIPSLATVNIRDDFNFVVKVRNNTTPGLGEADDVVFTDNLPAGMQLTGTPSIAVLAGTTTVATCTGSAGSTSFTCNLGTVSANAVVDITVPVQAVSATSRPQVFTNTASVATSSFDINLANNSNTGNVTVNSSSIAGRVFRDFNNDGLVTAGDTGISGVVMTLTGTAFDGGAVSITATTDASGNYVFVGVPAGASYQVAEGAVAETNLNDGTDTAGSLGGSTAVNDRVSAINVPANVAGTDYNFAEVPVARIGVAKAVQTAPAVGGDGTFTTTFRLQVSNYSLETVNNIVVTDVLNGAAPRFGNFVAGGAAAVLGNGDYTLQAAPSGTCAGLNAGFDGSGTPVVATIPSLASAANCQIDITVRVRPTAPQPPMNVCGGRYCNQASITGTGALSGQTPNDLSDNGTNPDPDSDGVPNEAGENDPTPVTPTYGPAISIAKSLNTNVSVQPDFSVLVPVRLLVTNTGNEPLSTVSVTDPLSTAAAGPFGTFVPGGAGATLAAGQYTVQTAPAFSGACTNGTATAAFTGHTGNLAVATISSMAVAAVCTVDFSYRFMPVVVTSYNNQAAVSGTSDFTATPVTSNSTVAVPYPRVGIAKRVVTATSPQADGTVIVPFSLVIRNLGGEALNTVTVTDAVSGAAPAFGTFVAGGAAATLAAAQYTVQVAPAFSGVCTNGSANAAYTGAAVTTVATVSSMAVNASCTVTFSLRFRPVTPQPPVSGVCGDRYCNQASVSGTGATSTLVTSDTSDDGTNTDTNGDGIANQAGENDPTPVPVAFTPRIGLAKTKPTAEVVNANGTVTVPFRIRVQNYGNEPLTGITVSDTVAGAAPRFGVFVAGGAAATLTNGQYTVETAPAINGACAAATLTGGFNGSAATQLASLTRLEVAEFCEFNFSLRFKPTSPLPVGGYANQANTAGTGEFSTTAVTDLSNNGANPDSNGNGDPSDDNTPTPVNSSYTPAIGIAKALQSGLIVNGNGSYTGTFRLVVRNLGNEELNSVTVTDLMTGVAPRFGTFVAGGAAAVLTAGQYTIQAAPVFVGACAGGTSNAGFDGNGTPLVASITQLAIAGSCTLDFSFRFAPQPGATYNNQAVANGTGAFSTTVVTDNSDDGANPDTNSNGNGNEAGENDPTPVPIPRIGVAKSAGVVVNNADGTYSVPFTLTVNNAGQTALSTVQVADTVAGQFGTYTAGVPAAGQYTIASGPTVGAQANGAALTAVGAGVFTGSGAGSALLVPGASSLPNFGAGTASSAQVQFTVRFFPTTAGPFSNTAIATGTSPAGGNVTDNSADGAVPDVNANGDPGDDTSPTLVSLSGQAIGVSKAVLTIVQTGPKRYRIPYTLIVQNVSTTVTATNVQVTDGLVATFPTAQSRIISTPAAVSACTGTVLAVAAPPFTGIGQNNLLAGNQNLQPGERCTISFTVEVDFGTNPLPAVLQNNQATATTAQTPGGTVINTDLSDNGNVPDANGNGNANEAGENDPTPVSFAAAGLSAVTGKVYLDRNHDRADNDGPAAPNVAGFIVEVLNAAGQIVGTATTAADGTYTIGGLFPSTPGDPATYYTLQFREPASGAIYGVSQSADPNPARNGVVTNGRITQLQLATGVTTLNQNLPLDPSGVVYDAVTRLPVSGATVTLLNGGAPVGTACLVGGVNAQVTGALGMYQFLLINPAPPGCPGNGTYTLQVTQPAGYLPPASALIPPTAGPHVPPIGGVDAIQAQAGPPTGGQPTTYFFSFTLTLGASADVVNNHIPLDPILGGAIVMTKTSPLINVVRGELVPYTITATNTLSAALSNISVVDVIPAGFRYRTGSATLNGVALEPVVNGRSLTWSGLAFAGSERKTWRMLLVVGSGVGEGNYVNQVAARNTLVNTQVSNTAEATVRVVPDPTFDCSDIIGKVFNDKNANGYQDEGEPGIANVRIATARGLLVTTDAEGRFHVACAAIPNADRGSNFVMKLDDRTLPSGYRLTTENPRDVRVTRGKMVKLNFGATVHRVIRLDLSGAAFVNDKTDLQPTYVQEVRKLPAQLAERPSVLRMAYRRGAESVELAEKRLQALAQQIRALWENQRKKENEESEPLHPLLIETELEVVL